MCKVFLGRDTDAILDRLIHSAHRLELKGESLRKMLPNKIEQQIEINN